VELEKSHGTKESLESTLSQAVKSCPKAEVLWLMAAKDRWLQNDLAGARDLLQMAFAANPNSEKIWLAAVKLEHENNEHSRARVLLQKARERAPTEKVWVKSIKLEREVNNHVEERKLLDEALKKFPQYGKFWILKGQLEEAQNREQDCRDNYTRGLRNCPHDIKLWTAAIAFEEKFSSGKARALLEKARVLNKKNEDLWLLAVRIELRAGNKKVAQSVMAKALQDCPTSGKLWAEAIEIENQQQQKARSVEALKRCDNDPHVIVAVAKIFWRDGKIDKARTWFNRAITLDQQFGDAWAYYYKFEAANGADEAKLHEIVSKCAQANPKQGEQWRKISKDPENWNLKPDQVLKKVAASVSFTPY
jgi:pre-mRNA-processing factor 6